MEETELKAYFYPYEEDAVGDISKDIAKKTGKRWKEESIVDTFFDRNKYLKKRGSELRLRMEGNSNFLAFKGKMETSSGYKRREEIEVNVSELRSTELLLNNLGFRKWREVRKVRKTIMFKDVQITIDIFPKIGYVMEVEGEEEKIEQIILELDLPRERFQPISYNDVLNRFIKKRKN